MQNADLDKVVTDAEKDNPELKTKDFIARAKQAKKELDKGLERVDAIDDPALRSVALIKLRDELGLNRAEFLRLVELLSKFKGDNHQLTTKNSVNGPQSGVNRLLWKTCLAPTA